MEFARSRGLDPVFVHHYAQAVEEGVELVDAGPRFRCSDPDDEIYTEASSGGRAAYVVTTDPALLDLKTVLEAKVVTPDEFAATLGL